MTPFIRRLFIFIAFISSNISLSQNLKRKVSLTIVEQDNGVKILSAKFNEHQHLFSAKIKQIKKGEIFFHWAKEETFNRLIREGLTNTEYEERLSYGKGLEAGGGFYIARDPLSSSGFGSHIAEVSASKKALYVELSPMEVFNDFYVSKTIGGSMTVSEFIIEINKSLSDLGIYAMEYRSIGSGKAWLNFIKNPASIISIHEVRPLKALKALLNTAPDLSKFERFQLIENLDSFIIKKLDLKVNIPQSIRNDLLSLFATIFNEDFRKEQVISIAKKFKIEKADILNFPICTDYLNPNS